MINECKSINLFDSIVAYVNSTKGQTKMKKDLKTKKMSNFILAFYFLRNKA